jgi:hypothetical protein
MESSIASSHENSDEEPSERGHNNVASKYRRQEPAPLIEIQPREYRIICLSPGAVPSSRFGVKPFTHRSRPRAVSPGPAHLAARVAECAMQLLTSALSSLLKRQPFPYVLKDASQEHHRLRIVKTSTCHWPLPPRNNADAVRWTPSRPLCSIRRRRLTRMIVARSDAPVNT